MKNKLYYIAMVILIGFKFSACTTDENNPVFEDIPVVEAYLNVGQPFEVKVSRQIPYSENAVFSSDDLDALEVSIFDGTFYYNLTSSGGGIYKDTLNMVEQSGTYELEFLYNNSTIYASTSIPSKPINFNSSVTEAFISNDFFTESDPDEIELSWNNTNGSYHVIFIENIESNPDAIYDFDGNTRDKQFSIPPTQTNNYSLRVRRFSYYGNHRVILFHVNPDYAALFNSTETTSQNLTNPPTEIENGYGIFTGLDSDTLFINVKPM